MGNIQHNRQNGRVTKSRTWKSNLDKLEYEITRPQKKTVVIPIAEVRLRLRAEFKDQGRLLPYSDHRNED